MGSSKAVMGGVAERRLRPLWDAIDGRQYKSALKLASGLLSKHPDSPYLLVLKGLVLERLGRADEALALCEQAREKEPVDDLVLNTLQIVYQRLNHPNEATLAYEVACKKCPHNLELMLALFNCYVRNNNFIKQQQLAMKMYKAFGEERFLLWAACNIFLQVRCGLGDEKKLLSLAEAMLRKRIDSHGLQELEALLLYIAILQDLDMPRVALDVLVRLRSLFSLKIEEYKLKGELLFQCQQYNDAVDLYKEILLLSPDDWESCLRFIDASLEVPVKLYNSSSQTKDQNTSTILPSSMPLHLSANEVKERLLSVKAFFKELQADKKDLRSPFLAIVEVEKRILLHNVVAGSDLQDGKKISSKKLAHSLLEYFERFGHLPCFLMDVKSYLVHLEDTERQWFVDAVQEACVHVQSKSSIQWVSRKIAAFHVGDELGLFATMSQRGILAEIAKISQLYLECVQMSSNLDPQESMYGEELLVIASNLLMELFRRSKKLAFLLEALLVLEFGLSLRRFNFNYKLMLINLYSVLGAVAPALHWYRTLDVKNILVETLSHHIMPSLLGAFHWLDLESLLKEVCKFHEDYQKDAADFLILAYQQNNYSKILEFVDLRQRLERSHNYTMARIEAAILCLKQKVDNVDEVEVLLASMDCGLEPLQLCANDKFSSLSFNEDLQTRPWWSPAPDELKLEGLWSSSLEAPRSLLGDDQDMTEKRHHRWRLMIKRRSMVPRLLFLVIKLSSTFNEREKHDTDNYDVLRMELRERLESYAQSAGLSWDCVNELISHETYKTFKLNIETEATFAVFYYAYQVAWQLAPTPGESHVELIGIDTIVRASIRTAFTSIRSLLVEASDSLAPGNSMFLLCRLVSEVIGWLGLMLQVWSKRLQPFFKKMKKCSSSTPEQTDTISDGRLQNNLRMVAHSLCDELELLISSLELCMGALTDQKADTLFTLIDPRRQEKTCDSWDDDFVCGSVLEVLESGIHSSECLLEAWKPDLVVRKVVSSQRGFLAGIRDMVSARLRLFRTIKF